jgi:hypothetical protein
VRQAETRGCDLSEMSLEDLRQFSPLVGPDLGYSTMLNQDKKTQLPCIKYAS